LLLPDVTVALDLELEPLAGRVDRAHTDTVQPGRDLVALVVELSASVEHGHDDLGGADALLVLSDRDAAAVVGDGDGLVEVERDPDVAAVTGEVLVDGVVDGFPDEVVQTR